MKLSQYDFNDRRRVRDIARHLQSKLNISDGRNILILLEDSASTCNIEALTRWVQTKVWQSLREENEVDINKLENALFDTLEQRSMGS